MIRWLSKIFKDEIVVDIGYLDYLLTALTQGKHLYALFNIRNGVEGDKTLHAPVKIVIYTDKGIRVHTLFINYFDDSENVFDLKKQIKLKAPYIEKKYIDEFETFLKSIFNPEKVKNAVGKKGVRTKSTLPYKLVTIERNKYYNPEYKPEDY